MGKLLRIILILTLSSSSFAIAQQYTIRGQITDAKSKETLPFVTVMAGQNVYALADENGRYELKISATSARNITLTVRLVGKRTERIELTLNPSQNVITRDITLQDNDNYMSEVVVTAERDDENVSVSAFKLDKDVIDQSQANSLGELLQLIPGQEIRNPDLQSAQAINFRSANTGQSSLNNSFGISIVMNDNQLNNNSNMQGRNPIQTGGFNSLGGSNSFRSSSFEGGENPGGGFDLRQISVGNIEKVEVIQGVASAKYGDMSNGAIIIETSAGQAPLNFSLRQARADQNFQLSKGFQLSERHSIFANIDYLNSRPDLRDAVKSFNRVGGGLMWSAFIGSGKLIKNTLDLKYNTTLDDFRIDPDFATERRVLYERRGQTVSNRTYFNLETPIFDNFKTVFSYNGGYDYSFVEQFVNPGVLPVTGFLGEGVNEGTFHPSSYRTTRAIEGKPVNISARLDFSKALVYKNTDHNISYGFTYNFNGNYGEGRVFDPLRPLRTSGVVSQFGNERPLSYREINPFLEQFGFYIEDGIKGEFLNKGYNLNLGLRVDNQFNNWSFSPRINSRYNVNENLTLTGAFGISYKAPGLIHLFPGPQFQDIPLINFFNGREIESLYLVYTYQRPNDASQVRPMQAYQREIGAYFKKGLFNVSVTAFLNENKNGFSVNTNRVGLDVPQYELVEVRENQRPIYQPTGEVRIVPVTERQVVNGNYDRSYGFEVVAATKKIEAINTSFSLNLSYYDSYYFNDNLQYLERTNFQPGDPFWFGVYSGTQSQGGNANGLFTINHHISKLGLVMALRGQVFIYNYQRSFPSTDRAVGYLNGNMEFVEIPESERDSPFYDILSRTEQQGNYFRRPEFTYFNAHFNLSKNLGKGIRFSFFANNFLNIRPELLDPITGTFLSFLNQDPYFGLELRFTY
ncbi:TonB-dependent receptor [Belliella pelovolcani]|uniref:TonB-dependent Receptor Plug Domain n=1 Tax=Belliella pelovolcani TaxID=529505 RepID=A0A1N7LWG8_9BACT|nr:TonB-dependent receptor [Belliella pelovolcani]SIS78198.1 TonB-dependent Receptor Plug Domain [Belliella pelovolcani]